MAFFDQVEDRANELRHVRVGHVLLQSLDLELKGAVFVRELRLLKQELLKLRLLFLELHFQLREPLENAFLGGGRVQLQLRQQHLLVGPQLADVQFLVLQLLGEVVALLFQFQHFVARETLGHRAHLLLLEVLRVK